MTDLITPIEVEDDYYPYDEEERDYWVGIGFIEFYVQQNVPEIGLFEIEIIDSGGCARGAEETIGLYWLIKYELGIELEKLKEGVMYTIHGLNVSFGDGWEIDASQEYNFTDLTYERNWFIFLKQKLYNIWWRNIGWKLKERSKKA